MRTSLAVVLAAGEGKRMKSRLPKVLHPVGRLPMLLHVLKAAEAGAHQAVVIAAPHAADDIRRAIKERGLKADVLVQEEQRGTAHAALVAREAFSDFDDIIVLFGDTPLVTQRTVERMREALAEGASVVVAGMRPADPSGYGRLIADGDQLVDIREERDATEAELAIRFCNGGIMGLAGATATDILDAIEDGNHQQEFYLTDAVSIAHKRGLKVVAIEIDADEVLGVNDRLQLSEVERLYQQRRRTEAIAEGATLLAPETVFFAHDTYLGSGVVIEPDVVFGEGVTVGKDVTIRAFSHLEGANLWEGAIVGPFARLRPGAEIGKGAHIGNFVEIKAAVVGAGAKINHLSYIGDARVGARTNVGAGTITCNYDGVAKHLTDIGEGAFIGSNSSLVAPVKIGDGAYVASGSTITEDVPEDALAFGRARQVNKPGRAAEKRKK